MSRDDFSQATKNLLAKRAGYRCCFPNCGRPSYGSSDESSSSITNIGVACHISSASSGQGARRYNPSMTSEERKHINNGIWMCSTHGKMIDDDEVRFSVDLLIKWRQIGEQIAKVMVEQNLEYNQAVKFSKFVDLAPETIMVDNVGMENELVGNLINDSCLKIVWGEEIAFKIRDFLIEHVRNAFQHGVAEKVEILVNGNSITVVDNGASFNPKDLLGQGFNSGGAISIQELSKEFNRNLVLASTRSKDKNTLVLSLLHDTHQILQITPCSQEISLHDFRRGELKLHFSKDCNDVFIVLDSIISYSDIGFLTQGIKDLEKHNKPITLITSDLSGRVLELLKAENPNLRIVKV